MKIELTLLSDAISGSGTGIASIIDQDITYDDFGIPYIPAKRIRGVLRESATELFELGVINKTDFDSFFSSRELDTDSNFYLDNGYIENYDQLKSLLNSHNIDKQLFNKEFVLDYYTYERTQTSIDNNGIAKENSLRTIRVLKKGLKFYFPVTFDSSKKDIKDVLEKICKITNHFGISRTRGFGEIKLNLIEEEPSQANTGTDINFSSLDGDKKYILNFKIKNLNPLLLNSNTNSNQETDTYISGTIIKGLLASIYLKDGSKKPEDDIFKDLFLSEEIIFSHFYPCTYNDSFIPFPNNIVKNKTSDNFYNLLNEEQFNEVLDGDIKTKNYSGYISTSFDSKLNVKTDIEYHHQRPKDRSFGHATKKAGEFFQFEIIKENQAFQGSIIGEKDLLEKVYELFKSQNYTIYVGRSKIAQYGKCIIENISVDKLEEQETTWFNNSELTFLLESDMILENENGYIVPDIKILVREILENNNVFASEDKIEIVKSYLKTSKISGFMSSWKMPKEQIQCLKAGSIFVLKNNTNQALKISSPYFGLKNSEGFGKVRFENFDSEINSLVSSSYQLETDNIDKTNEEVKKLLKFIIKKALERELLNLAVEKANKSKIPPSNFIAKLKFYINEANGFNTFKDHIKNFKEFAKDNLKPIQENCFIKKDTNILIPNIETFKKESNQLHPSNTYSGLINIIRNDLDVKEVFYPASDPEYFELYKYYLQNYLNILKLKGRTKND